MTIASKSVRRSYYYYYYPYYKEKERKVNFRTRFFLMLANEFSAFEHSPLFFVDIIIHCSLLRTCRVRVEEKEEFLVYTVLWTLTCHPYLESATALSDSSSLMSQPYFSRVKRGGGKEEKYVWSDLPGFCELHQNLGGANQIKVVM